MLTKYIVVVDDEALNWEVAWLSTTQTDVENDCLFLSTAFCRRFPTIV